MKNLLTPLFAAVLCLALLAGCSSKKPIVGKWTGGDGSNIEFTEDGKLLMNMGSMSVNATYTLPDADHFKMEIDMGGTKSSKTIAYKVDGDTMTTEDSGKKQTLKRAR